MVVEAQKYGAFNANAVVVVAFHTFLDIVGGVVNSLIHVPCPCLRCEVEHLRVVLDGVAYPFLFQGNHLAEKVEFPLFVLRQRVIHDKQAVVVDAFEVGDGFVDRTRPETASAEVRHGTGVAAETASARGVEEVHHLHALVVV